MIMWDQPAPSDQTAPSPLQDMADHALRVSDICDLLEAMADDLPRRPAPVWKEARRMCDDVVRVHYALLLDVLLPVLSTRLRGQPDCEHMLTRLNADFEEEASKLTELTALMTDAVSDRARPISPEALGYALRCFFCALRRNAMWETDVLLPLAKRALSADDLESLTRLMRLDPVTGPS